jgi:integrase
MVANRRDLSLDVRESFDNVLRSLAPVPSLICYYDDFDDNTKEIHNLNSVNIVDITLDGKRNIIRFDVFGLVAPVIKLVFADWLARVNPRSVVAQMSALKSYVSRFGLEDLIYLVSNNIYETRGYWNDYVSASASAHQCRALHAMFHSLCRLSIGYWNPVNTRIISTMRLPKVDKFRVVRTGECFLPLDDQALIVNYIDEVCARTMSAPVSVRDIELRDACVLVCSYQYGLRPGQISRITIPDVRVHETGAVHIAFIATKQRRKAKRVREVRRIKREWAPMFIELLQRRERDGWPHNPNTQPTLLFRMTPGEIGLVVSEVTETETEEAWTATELRHTSAQRQVDAGTSHVELSRFLFHTNIQSANVYFDTSPAQAQRINEALAISPIYANIAKIARTRTIDMEMLRRLPPDNQIGGVPHGIPIAGIGGCKLGQSLCVKNPVLSCYTCGRFMPVKDAAVHEQVLQQLRPVVHEFAAASRNNDASPSYVQLRLTLDSVRRVAEDVNVAGDVE